MTITGVVALAAVSLFLLLLLLMLLAFFYYSFSDLLLIDLSCLTI